MSNSTSATPSPETGTDLDTVESIVPMMPLILPLAGGVLMLLLASIAVFMA